MSVTIIIIFFEQTITKKKLKSYKQPKCKKKLDKKNPILSDLKLVSEQLPNLKRKNEKKNCKRRLTFVILKYHC